MRVYKLFIFFLLILAVGLVSCGEKVFDLEERNIKRIAYHELPDEVKQYIDDNIDEIVRSNGEVYDDLYHSTDPSIVFTYGKSGRSDNWINEVSSNYHHFFIDGVHYRMRGNRGHPFILHERILCFGDLNLYKDDYKTRSYLK